MGQSFPMMLHTQGGDCPGAQPTASVQLLSFPASQGIWYNYPDLVTWPGHILTGSPEVLVCQQGSLLSQTSKHSLPQALNDD